MFKVVWLAPYQISLLEDYLKFTRPIKKDRAASWIVNLSNELAKHCELHIITKSAHIYEDSHFLHNGIYFHIVKYKFPFLDKGFPRFLPFDKLTLYYPLVNRIISIVNDINPDVVHAHGTEYAYGYATTKLEQKSIVSIQGIINEIRRGKHDFQKLVEIKTFKNQMNFGCRTEWNKKIILKYNPSANIYYLPEAINPIFFNSQWVYNEKQEITFVGSISKMKGVDNLIDAFIEIIKYEKLKIRLNLIGNGERYFLNLLSKKLISCQVENEVMFHGFREPGYVKDILLQSNLFILPTLMDNSPNSLIESQALGIPCAASNIGGIPSLVEHGYNGFLFKPNDKDAIRECIISTLSNKDKLKVISNNSRKDAYEHNYPLKVAQITLDVYRKIINENH